MGYLRFVTGKAVYMCGIGFAKGFLIRAGAGDISRIDADKCSWRLGRLWDVTIEGCGRRLQGEGSDSP